MEELMLERWELARGRIGELVKEVYKEDAFGTYFKEEAKWFLHLFETADKVEDGSLFSMSMEELETLNQEHFGELIGENYEKSYANPSYAVSLLGEEYGKFFSAMHVQFRQTLGYVYDGEKELFLSLAELFLEIYGTFAYVEEELQELPLYEEVRKIYYWYTSDYAELRSEKQVRDLVCPMDNPGSRIVKEADLQDLRYLYFYGEYVSESTLRTVKYLNSLPEETIATMADTFTEGYRIGFAATNKDISIKKTAGLRYTIGFERVIRHAVENFKRIGLDSVISRGQYEALPANRQYQFDHKDDEVLFLDKQYLNRKLETMKAAYEQYKTEAALYGGPAVMEVFGEEPFAPASRKEALKGDEKYKKLRVEYMSQAGRLRCEYIKEEERSFTIIAFPTPDIGDNFEEIFAEIIRINTLDYKLYQGIQQHLIDALDRAEYVEIKGMKGNRTDLRVMLCTLENAESQTRFENCVADVNIPVGEVFTSPKLTGTNGILHVSRVFLNELEYKDLEIRFEDGMTVEYTCKNFPDEEEGVRYLRENVLMNHEKLPMGEFAIGTNTTAYVMAQKYDIGAKLPILIAEKMGPHFAVGDTCYSQAEDVKVYNPDGKEIIARDNEISLMRHEDLSKAYFNCHTDITIPYHELGLLCAVGADGERIEIIKEGRFVLPGCEELNKPFEKV